MGRLHDPLNILILLVYFVSSVYTTTISTGDSDKLALLELKSSFLDPSGLLTSWVSSNKDHCSWVGVTCGSDYRVVALNITGICSQYDQFPLYGFGIRKNCLSYGSGNNGKLLGKLSSSISKLSELRVLSFPFNDLSGELPSEIWGLEKLEILDLEGNLIGGLLPVNFDGLRNLRVLNLGFNEISGEIPGSLLYCKDLQVLKLARNNVNGSIPRFVGQFGDLRGVYLSFNRLAGIIPNEIGDNCGKLEHLELSGNFLVGGIPSSLGNCSGLKSILLYSNVLEELIPVELGQLSMLEVLDVSRNSLSGSIPLQPGNCSALSVLVLSNLWDPLPSAINSVGNISLASATPEYNYFEGALPVEIITLPKLRLLWAPRATLEGKFPSNWGTCSSLEMVNLAQNYFIAGISDGLSSCKKLRFLDLSSNKLTGELTRNLSVPCMTVFDISNNLLSGSIPSFQYPICSAIPSLNGYDSGPFDLLSVYLQYFELRGLKETHLPLFGDLSNHAVVHNFGGNNFTGTFSSLPIATDRLDKKTVYAFLAGGTNLAGPFPEVLFGKCSRVRAMIVNISYNRLSGQIPADIGSMCKSLVVLDASRNQIFGIIPSSFGDLGSLVALNLSFNPLRGIIPSSLGQIKNLKNLALAGNHLTGPIPLSFGQFHSLGVLELHYNSLVGEIPKDIINLRNLSILLLNNNKLSGHIPSGLANLTALDTFNVSFNNLSGPLPLNENLMKCSSFLGNPFLQSCHLFSLTSPPLDQQGNSGVVSQNYEASPSGSRPARSGNGSLSQIEIAAITSASAIVSVLIALIILFIYTRWKPRSRVCGTIRKEVTIFTDIGVPLTFENVVRSTGSFNGNNCIGNGGFGATYKAEVSPGLLVAIKRLSVGRFQGVLQFDAEIRTLGRLRHPNLVTLIGYHASGTEMFLIYNYLPGGNLEKLIQERSTRAVDWRVLHKIALDVARALAYLHDQCVPRVLHRDVKPSNILLDDHHNAYLSDFGLARLLGTSETHATTGVAGTFGYVAPEYAMTCRVSDKADVYSYGVVLLELISDKKLLDPSFSSYGNGFNIVQWGCMLVREGRAKEFFASGLWDAGPHEDLVEVLRLAVVCTVETLSHRHTMKQVVKILKQMQPRSC